MKGFLSKFVFCLTVLSQCVCAEAQVQTVDGVAIKVSDMDEALNFYTKVLPFEKISDVLIEGDGLSNLDGLSNAQIRNARLRLGDETIELVQFQMPIGKPVSENQRSNDASFQHIAIVVSNMEKAYAQLREHRVEHVSSSPQTLPDWNRNAAGIKAFYFRDPDSHNLEIIYFPPGKGQPKWQKKTDRIFLGIDHTAIVVRDTEASLKFYRDVLGFRVAGNSENYGYEQEHLNGVFGAHLLITSLRAASGPGIEFLEYLSPADGRNRAADVALNDLVDTETIIGAESADVLSKIFNLTRARVVSSSESVVPELGIHSGFVVRDPDGHALRVIQ